jgi:hypothetical protein
MENPLKDYLEYLNNVGRQLSIEEFCDDWQPVGQMVLKELISRDYVDVEYKISISEKGKEALDG